MSILTILLLGVVNGEMSPFHVGCYIENSGFYVRQISPQWCSSMEECRCPSQYPYVGFTNGNTNWMSGKAEWSCFMELPSTKATGCTTKGDWHVGARGWKTSIYRNPSAFVVTTPPTSKPTPKPIVVTTSPTSKPTPKPIVVTTPPTFKPTPKPIGGAAEDCVQRKSLEDWTEDLSKVLCPEGTTGMTNRGYGENGARMCSGAGAEYQDDLELSLANALYLNCANWCVYSYETFPDAHAAYMWKPAGQCWQRGQANQCITSPQKAVVDAYWQRIGECSSAATGEDRCVPEIEVSFDYYGDDLREVHNVASAKACNMICGAEKECLSWSWGKKRGKWYTDVCFLLRSVKPNRQADDCCDAGVPCKGETEAEADCNDEEFGRTCLAQFSEGDACTVLRAAFLEDLDEGELETKMMLAGIDMRCFECGELAHQIEEICMSDDPEFCEDKEFGSTCIAQFMDSDGCAAMKAFDEGEIEEHEMMQMLAGVDERCMECDYLGHKVEQMCRVCEERDLRYFLSSVQDLGSESLILTCIGDGRDRVSVMTSALGMNEGMGLGLVSQPCKCVYALHEPQNLQLVDEHLPECTIDWPTTSALELLDPHVKSPDFLTIERTGLTPLRRVLTENLRECIATGSFSTAKPWLDTEPTLTDYIESGRTLTPNQLEATLRLVKASSKAATEAELPAEKKKLKALSKVANDARKLLKKFRTRAAKAQKN